MISLKPHLQGIVKGSQIGQEEQSSSLGAFIAGVVLGVTGAIFTMTLAIKTKPLNQKALQEKFSKYSRSPQKTVLMRVM
jgi:hypothetical protein